MTFVGFRKILENLWKNFNTSVGIYLVHIFWRHVLNNFQRTYISYVRTNLHLGAQYCSWTFSGNVSLLTNLPLCTNNYNSHFFRTTHSIDISKWKGKEKERMRKVCFPFWPIYDGVVREDCSVQKWKNRHFFFPFSFFFFFFFFGKDRVHLDENVKKCLALLQRN